MGGVDQLARLGEIMARLRAECPWDSQQTHASLVRFLLSEVAEVVEAIETGDDEELAEELGDLLLQVFFHCEIARREGRFDVQEVARGVCDKMVRRHPHVFGEARPPGDETEMWDAWEAAKRAEKGRASALEGIASPLSALAALQETVLRVRTRRVPLALPDAPIGERAFADQLLALVARGHASGIDCDQAARGALRRLRADVVAAEAQEAREAREAREAQEAQGAPTSGETSVDTDKT